MFSENDLVLLTMSSATTDERTSTTTGTGDTSDSSECLPSTCHTPVHESESGHSAATTAATTVAASTHTTAATAAAVVGYRSTAADNEQRSGPSATAGTGSGEGRYRKSDPILADRTVGEERPDNHQPAERKYGQSTGLRGAFAEHNHREHLSLVNITSSSSSQSTSVATYPSHPMRCMLPLGRE